MAAFLFFLISNDFLGLALSVITPRYISSWREEHCEEADEASEAALGLWRRSSCSFRSTQDSKCTDFPPAGVKPLIPAACESHKVLMDGWFGLQREQL